VVNITQDPKQWIQKVAWPMFAVVLAVISHMSDIAGLPAVLNQYGIRLTPLSLRLTTTALIGVVLIWIVLQVKLNRKSLLDSEKRLQDTQNSLVELKSSLPILFAKTSHLREQLSADRLTRYRESIRTGATKYVATTAEELEQYQRKLAVHDKTIYLENHRQIILESTHALLADLRRALEHLTHHDDFTISIQFYTGPTPHDKSKLIPLAPVYDAEPGRERTEAQKRRIEQEKDYLGSGASLGRHCLLTPKSPDEVHHYLFNSIEEAAKFHTEQEWPDIKSHLQSLVLAAIKSGTAAIAVLQVDCPRKNGFTREIGHMIECTAHGLGAFFAVLDFLSDRSLESLKLEEELSATKIDLDKSQTTLVERQAALDVCQTALDACQTKLDESQAAARKAKQQPAKDLQQLKSIVETAEQTIEDLKKQIDILKMENANLRGSQT